MLCLNSPCAKRGVDTSVSSEQCTELQIVKGTATAIVELYKYLKIKTHGQTHVAEGLHTSVGITTKYQNKYINPSKVLKTIRSSFPISSPPIL